MVYFSLVQTYNSVSSQEALLYKSWCQASGGDSEEKEDSVIPSRSLLSSGNEEQSEKSGNMQKKNEEV
jgi:hypothetical protein